MADVFTKAKRSEVVSHIRSRGNKETELALGDTVFTLGFPDPGLQGFAPKLAP